MQPNATYASYLLRLRRVWNDEHPTWVVSIQSTATGEQQSFADVGALIAFLWTEFGRGQEASHAAINQITDHTGRG